MAVTVITVRTEVIDQGQVEGQSPCPRCGSKTRLITTSYISTGFATREQVRVTCANCNKKFRKNSYDKNIAQIVEEKKRLYRVSFLKKYGYFIFIFIIVFGGLAFILNQTHSERQQNKKVALENFVEASKDGKEQQWYDNIGEGDYLFASKNYNEPARVYLVKTIHNDTTVLIEYEQYINRDQYVEPEQLKTLELSQHKSREMLVKTSNIRRGIIEEISDNPMAVASGYIRQIKKKD